MACVALSDIPTYVTKCRKWFCVTGAMPLNWLLKLTLDDFRHRGFGCFFRIACHEPVAKGIYNWQAAVHVVRVPFFVAGTASAEEAVESFRMRTVQCSVWTTECRECRV